MLKRPVIFALLATLFLHSTSTLAHFPKESLDSKDHDASNSECPYHNQAKSNEPQSTSSWVPSILTLATTAGAVVTAVVYIRTRNLGVAVLTALGIGSTVLICGCSGTTQFRPCPKKMGIVFTGLAAILGVTTLVQNQRLAQPQG